MTTTALPATITDNDRNTVVTGTVTAIAQPTGEITMRSEMVLTLTTTDGQTVEVAAPVANNGVAKDLAAEVGQTITAGGTLRNRDGRIAAVGFRDDAEVLHYWVIG